MLVVVKPTVRSLRSIAGVSRPTVGDAENRKRRAEIVNAFVDAVRFAADQAGIG